LSYQATTLRRLPSRDFGELRVDDGTVRIVQHVGGDDRVFGVSEDAFELAFGGGFECGVDLVRGGVSCSETATRSTTENIGRRNPHRVAIELCL